MSTVYENMNTKGWRHDVTPTQVSRALKSLECLNRTGFSFVYEVKTKDETPNLVFGSRDFFLVIEGPIPEHIKVAGFDSYGNFMIYPKFLTDGGISDLNDLPVEAAC
mgnify:CR=1 FL=1